MLTTFLLRMPRFRDEDYTVHVRLSDYLDIICPHYEDDSVAEAAMERYTLYLVEQEDYQQCQPRSKDQVRWQCNQPNAKHGPEKLSEKFQRFTPFTLGKEFKEGHSYYYICECPGRELEGPDQPFTSHKESPSWAQRLGKCSCVLDTGKKDTEVDRCGVADVSTGALGDLGVC